jgi:DNA invertase Pin-like site-specific DNA recombinase
LLPAAVLKRKAVVYIRQSTQVQVQTNLESRRRQYELVEVARQRGFRDVEVIDDDLGRSAGTTARPGFDRLVAWLCAGQVGAVLCFDASRLARNGRDWHHLLELCGLVDARVIDLDGIYDPCRPNDRLLLGMKGSIREFELGVLRARMLEAARVKARRGELRISVPIGYIWHREIGLGFDPDRRIQEVVRLIFAAFASSAVPARCCCRWRRGSASVAASSARSPISVSSPRHRVRARQCQCRRVRHARTVPNWPWPKRVGVIEIHSPDGVRVGVEDGVPIASPLS